MYPYDDLWRELETSTERVVQAQREVELLGWLPTAAVHTALTRLAWERSRQTALLRLLWFGDDGRRLCQDSV